MDCSPWHERVPLFITSRSFPDDALGLVCSTSYIGGDFTSELI
jgi:hypothetical protein